MLRQLLCGGVISLANIAIHAPAIVQQSGFTGTVVVGTDLATIRIPAN